LPSRLCRIPAAFKWVALCPWAHWHWERACLLMEGGRDLCRSSYSENFVYIKKDNLHCETYPLIDLVIARKRAVQEAKLTTELGYGDEFYHNVKQRVVSQTMCPILKQDDEIHTKYRCLNPR
jgi:hypothetical protein